MTRSFRLTSLLLTGALLASAPSLHAHEPDGAIPPIAELPLQKAASARCAITLALIARWQNDGAERAAAYPAIDTLRGREFFVRTFSRLMDEYGIADRSYVAEYVLEETQKIEAMERKDFDALVPACNLLLETAQL
jgi:hypothetical protein